MGKICFIVFSKNRPMQVHALLDTLTQFVDVDIVGEIKVLYTSDVEFDGNYDTVKAEFPHIKWVREISGSFRSDTISLLNTNCEYTSFLVDDILFFGKVDSKCLPHEDELCFSLRLGKNCNFSHPANSSYSLPPISELENMISWEWPGCEYDFGYPMSLDGHIFKSEEISKMVKNVYFTNPNSLESSLAYQNPYLQHGYGTSRVMRSYDRSKIVGVPVNRVNTQFPNRFGEEYSYTETELNRLYAEGSRICTDEMDFNSINGPHKELQYVFK